MSPATGFAHFVNALTWRESFHFNLPGQDGDFLVIQQSKERDVSQFLRIAGHAHLVLKLGIAWPR